MFSWKREERCTVLVSSKSGAPGGIACGISYSVLMRLWLCLKQGPVLWLSPQGYSSFIIFFSHIWRTMASDVVNRFCLPGFVKSWSTVGSPTVQEFGGGGQQLKMCIELILGPPYMQFLPIWGFAPAIQPTENHSVVLYLLLKIVRVWMDPHIQTHEVCSKFNCILNL